MYTNIKTGLAFHRIGQLALENKENLTVPPAVLMDALQLLMTNNVFQLGETYCLQKVGTAMGAPPAPSLESTRRQCSQDLDISYNCIVASLTTSYAFGWLIPTQSKISNNGCHLLN